jgi:pentatricopeptide repeat protein
MEIFDWLRSLEYSGPAGHELAALCDVYTYTTAITMMASGQQLRRALELLAEMRSRGIPCNVHTYSSLMNVCIKVGRHMAVGGGGGHGHHVCWQQPKGLLLIAMLSGLLSRTAELY